MKIVVIYFESESAITKEMIEEEESILTELLSCSCGNSSRIQTTGNQYY